MRGMKWYMRVLLAVAPCGDPPYGIEVLEICYAEGRGYWYRVECYDECPLRR